MSGVERAISGIASSGTSCNVVGSVAVAAVDIVNDDPVAGFSSVELLNDGLNTVALEVTSTGCFGLVSAVVFTTVEL